jgi:hypothetical protein
MDGQCRLSCKKLNILVNRIFRLSRRILADFLASCQQYVLEVEDPSLDEPTI